MYQTGRVVTMFVVLLYLLTHMFWFAYSLRGFYVNFEKVGNITIYKTFTLMYASRSSVNVINLLADLAALTALFKANQCLMRSSRSWTFLRCFTDVRDGLAFLIGSSLILTVASLCIRGCEVYFLIFEEEDCLDGLLDIHRKLAGGNRTDPDFNYHRISVFAALNVCSSLFVGFKCLLTMRCYEFYEDAWYQLKKSKIIHEKDPPLVHP
ncbi:uncharacterized protein LOC135395289 [Ornithodoros turicata]|uniref:uncharacterized protein LOC135395289 n=1 Tax=Ornithodoros turicata TaxID=34597 RepID=UPI0031392D91